MQDIVYTLATSSNYTVDGCCFAGRASGLYRSIDGGKTWDYTYDSLNLQAPLTTVSVALSPTFASDRTLFAGVQGGILRSFDAGHTWYIAQLPPPPPLVTSLVISPDFANDGVLIAGTMEDGIFRSGNQGHTWSKWNFGLLDLGVLALAISPGFAQDDTLFLGTETSLYRSANGGRAWREINFPTDLAPVLSLTLSPHFPADGTLFAGTETNGLFKSTDHGQTWQPIAVEIPRGPINAIILNTGATPDLHILIVAGSHLLVSRDGGQTWHAWNPDYQAKHSFAAIAAPQGLAPNAPLLIGTVEDGVEII
jgi:photosystem II stability/assembly factor-like uncharacterized protein